MATPTVVSMPIEAVMPSKRPSARAVLDSRDVQILCDYGTLIDVSSGELVGRAGHPPDHVIVVKDGEIEIATRTANGRRVVLALAQAGRPIGDIPFLLNQPMMFDAIARTRSTLVSLDREHWLQMLAASPDLAYRWMKSVARRLDADRRRLMVLTTRNLTAQVAFLLLEQAQTDGIVKLTHATLAGMVGARRQSITRVLTQLRDEELISTTYGTVRIVDWSALRALVGSDLHVRLPEGFDSDGDAL